MYNFHTHTVYSDGKREPIEYVQYAISNGMDVLGFSDHSPVPFNSSWNMPVNKLNGYIGEISRLKNEFSGINIRLGLEVDYFDEFDAADACGYDLSAFDYIIGAIHYLSPEGITVDSSKDETDQLFYNEFHGDSKSFVSAYFTKYRNMLNALKPNIAAHIDLISKQNTGFCYYREDDKFFLDEFYKTLVKVKELGVFLEINTGAISRGRDIIYPSQSLIGMVKDCDIPVLFNADAHTPQTLLCHFSEVEKIIRAFGLRKADLSDIIK